MIVFWQVRFSEDIGEIYKIRLGFEDDDHNEQNWLLNTVTKTFHSVLLGKIESLKNILFICRFW